MKKYKRALSITIAVAIIAYLVFALCLTVNKSEVSNDITNKNPGMKIVAVKELKSTVIVNAQSDTDTGYYSYAKVPFFNKYYCGDKTIYKDVISESEEQLYGSWKAYDVEFKNSEITIINSSFHQGITAVGNNWIFVLGVIIIVLVFGITKTKMNIKRKRQGRAKE